MNATKIPYKLPKLSLANQNLVRVFLNSSLLEGIEETPEMLAAIDEGIRSLEKHGGIPIEVVQTRLEKKWSIA